MKYSELKKNSIYKQLIDDRILLQYTGFSKECVCWGTISRLCQFVQIDKVKNKVVGNQNVDFVEDGNGDYVTNLISEK